MTTQVTLILLTMAVAFLRLPASEQRSPKAMLVTFASVTEAVGRDATDTNATTTVKIERQLQVRLSPQNNENNVFWEARIEKLRVAIVDDESVSVVFSRSQKPKGQFWENMQNAKIKLTVKPDGAVAVTEFPKALTKLDSIPEEVRGDLGGLLAKYNLVWLSQHCFFPRLGKVTKGDTIVVKSETPRAFDFLGSFQTAGHYLVEDVDEHVVKFKITQEMKYTPPQNPNRSTIVSGELKVNDSQGTAHYNRQTGRVLHYNESFLAQAVFGFAFGETKVNVTVRHWHRITVQPAQSANAGKP